MKSLPSPLSQLELSQLFGYEFTSQEAKNIAQKVQRLELDAGVFWKVKGSEAALYWIKSGKVRLIDDKRDCLATLTVGEVFGFSTLFPTESFGLYTARATANTVVYCFPAALLLHIPANFPEARSTLYDRAISLNQRLFGEQVVVAQEQKSPQLFVPPESIEPPLKPIQIFPSPQQRAGHLFRKIIQRYPFHAQQSQSDCGAACLVMVSRFWGRKCNINRLRDVANVDRHGASLRGLSSAAESIGFVTRPVKASLDKLAEQDLPAIAHWDGNHYVVVYEVTKRHVIIADPARGQKTLSHNEFKAGWTNYTLLLQPTAILRKGKDDSTTFWQFFELLKPHRLVLFEIFIASVFIQIFGLITPLFTQLILDRVVVQQSKLTLNAIGIGLILFTAFRVMITALRQYLLDQTATRVNAALIVGFVRHTFRLPLNFFESRYVGDIISRVQENRKIQRFLTGEALSIILDLITVFIYVGLMAWYSWKMALLSLIIVPPYIVLAVTATPFLQRISREIFGSMANESSYLIEALTGVRTVKSLAVEQTVRWRWEERLNESIKKTFAGEVIQNRLQIFSSGIEGLATAGLLWFGAYQVINAQLTIGQLVAFNMLLGNVIQPFQRLAILWNEVQEVRVSIERLNDVLEAEPEEDLQNQPRQILSRLEGHIRFDNLTFRYHAESDINTLENVTFSAKPGETIALVGRSGSGKTTLAKLILGLYAATDGQLLIDHQDITSLSLRSIRSHTGVVDQDTFLFGGTIRENIAISRPSATLEEVERAAELAGADLFIKKMPLGFEAKVGEGGGMLSGGQRQRLAIARALLSNPQLLIFDEATSHLDTESEQIIQKNLLEIRKGRTTIIIAHRLSTIRHADKILVLDQGRLIESGNHQALMEKQGLYYYLIKKQREDEL